MTFRKISCQIERTVHGETIFRCTKAGKSTGDVSTPQNQEIGIRFEASIIGRAFAGSYFIPDQEGNMRVGGPKSYEAEIIFVFVAK